MLGHKHMEQLASWSSQVHKLQEQQLVAVWVNVRALQQQQQVAELAAKACSAY